MNNKLNDIAEYYLSSYTKDIRQGSPALLGGRGGVMIFQALMYKLTKDERFKVEVLNNLDFIIDRIENVPGLLSPTHAVGLAGTGCLLFYIAEQNLIDTDLEEFMTDADEYLIENLDIFLKKKEYDILHGALGIGMYFIKRKNYLQVEKIINSLDQNKLVFNEEVAWSRFDKVYTMEDVIDFGLAHGVCSILYFLTQCYKNGIMKDKTKNLSTRLLKFLFNNVQDPSQHRSVFPYHITVSEYESKKFHKGYARLAWCYGDIGMLYTILASTKVFGINEFDDIIKSSIDYQILRRTYDDTGVKDAGFCHGSSGITYLWQKIYTLTGDERHKDMADFWMKMTLDFATNESGIEGYKFHMGDSGWLNMSDILTGLAGVGLVLISNEKNYQYDGWDSCFYLDIL